MIDRPMIDVRDPKVRHCGAPASEKEGSADTRDDCRKMGSMWSGARMYERYRSDSLPKDQKTKTDEDLM